MFIQLQRPSVVLGDGDHDLGESFLLEDGLGLGDQRRAQPHVAIPRADAEGIQVAGGEWLAGKGTAQLNENLAHDTGLNLGHKQYPFSTLGFLESRAVKTAKTPVFPAPLQRDQVCFRGRSDSEPDRLSHPVSPTTPRASFARRRRR